MARENSPRSIPALVTQVFEICNENSELLYRATKTLLKFPKMAVYSYSVEQMSQKDQAHRSREIVQYYLSKVDKIASDQSYPHDGYQTVKRVHECTKKTEVWGEIVNKSIK